MKLIYLLLTSLILNIFCIYHLKKNTKLKLYPTGSTFFVFINSYEFLKNETIYFLLSESNYKISNKIQFAKIESEDSDISKIAYTNTSLIWFDFYKKYAYYFYPPHNKYLLIKFSGYSTNSIQGYIEIIVSNEDLLKKTVYIFLIIILICGVIAICCIIICKCIKYHKSKKSDVAARDTNGANTPLNPPGSQNSFNDNNQSNSLPRNIESTLL